MIFGSSTRTTFGKRIRDTWPLFLPRSLLFPPTIWRVASIHRAGARASYSSTGMPCAQQMCACLCSLKNFLRGSRTCQSMKHRPWPHSNRNRRLYGLSVNQNNRNNNRRVEFDVDWKSKAAASYQRCKEANIVLQPDLAQVTCNLIITRPNYVEKMESEMLTHHGRVLHLEEKKPKQKIGPRASIIGSYYFEFIHPACFVSHGSQLDPSKQYRKTLSTYREGASL